MAGVRQRGILAGLLGSARRRRRAGRRVRALRHPSLGRARGRGADRDHRPAALHRQLHASRAATASSTTRYRTPPRSGPTARRPASGRGGLLAKARGDYRRLLAALYNAGLLRAGDQHPRGGARGRRPDARRRIRRRRCRSSSTIEPGPPFRFGRTDDRQRAAAAGAAETRRRRDRRRGRLRARRAGARRLIDQASAVSIERWRHLGRAKAAETGREVIADHASRPARCHPRPRSRPRWRATGRCGSRAAGAPTPPSSPSWPTCPRATSTTPTTSHAGQDRLARLGVFRSIRIEEAEAIGPDGSLPITVRVEDRRPRTIGAGATLSTIDGLGLAGVLDAPQPLRPRRAAALRREHRRAWASADPTNTTTTSASPSPSPAS